MTMTNTKDTTEATNNSSQENLEQTPLEPVVLEKKPSKKQKGKTLNSKTNTKPKGKKNSKNSSAQSIDSSSLPVNALSVKKTTQQSAKKAAQKHKQATLAACELHADQLKKYADLPTLPASTRRVKPLKGFVGQQRALAALSTALAIHASGYHVFASGRNGLGKRTMIMRHLAAHAKDLPTPRDWVYVNNFKYARKPQALSFEAGGAKVFKKKMGKLWNTLLDDLRIRFRADRYLTQVDIIRKQIAEAQESAFAELTEEGKQLNLQLVSQDDRHEFIPIEPEFDDSAYVELEPRPCDEEAGGASQQQSPHKAKQQAKGARSTSTVGNTNLEPVTGKTQGRSTEAHLPPHSKKHPQTNSQLGRTTPQATVRLTTAEAVSSKRIASAAKAELEKNKRHMQKKLTQLSRHLENLEFEANKEIDVLNEQITADVLEPLLKPLVQEHKNNPHILEYLGAYKNDVITHVEDILGQTSDDFMPGLFEPVPVRYQVNIVVANQPNSGAPVVFEDMPTHYNLIGHVEQVTIMGSVTTDFSLIRAGSLHAANGGFLVLEAISLLEQPYAWQGLKRALQSKQVKLSSLEQMITLTGSISLSPDTIPLDVKVVLLGEPSLYYELLELEPEFDSVFKVRADFSERMARTADNEAAYIQMIADYVRDHELLPFKRDALGALIEDASRAAEEQTELCLHAGNLGQMLLEADQIAKTGGAKEVTAAHIKQTLEARTYRMGYLRELYWQDLSRGHQLISTQGTAVGQVNALTVIMYADSEFGLPARLTATAHQGHGEILDVERDVDLAGSLHAKGMLIMASFLRSLFGQDNVLSFTAALTFEQNYGQIDGDSATLAECCALISAISGIEVNQGIAITGSMNQFGDVQPIGGVNAKIEGFFDTCKLQELNESQGVIIPKQNLSQLMLRDDVIDAVRAGDFHLYAIDHVSEALELLLNTPAGKLSKKGKYPKTSIFGKVEAQLEFWRGENEKRESKKKRKK